MHLIFGIGRDFLSCLLAFDPRGRRRVDEMLDHKWICDFIPSYSRIFPFQTEALLTPKPTDQDALACSQSFQQLHLSDGSSMAIPGLTAASGNSPENIEPTPPPIDVGVPSFSSDISLTTKMPGAFPKGRNPDPLPAIAEGGSGVLLGQPESAEVMRLKAMIAGSSPLSSLSSDDNSEDSVPVEEPEIESRRQHPITKRKRVDDPSFPEVVPPKPKRPVSGRKAVVEAPVRKSTRTRTSKKA